MRLTQEEMIGFGSEEEREMESSSSCGSIVELGFQEKSMKVVVVGYALTSKKIKSFSQPKLEGLARNKGIFFVAIDQMRPLSDQGPFDILLHKLSGKEWQQILEDYWLTHPEVTVLDPPGLYNLFTIGNQCFRMWLIWIFLMHMVFFLLSSNLFKRWKNLLSNVSTKCRYSWCTKTIGNRERSVIHL